MSRYKKKSVDRNAYADRRTLVQTLDANAETSFSTTMVKHKNELFNSKVK